MKRVSITDLKAKLSEHLAAVRTGEEVIVTDRGRPIARLGPVEGEREMESRITSLVRAGRLRPPTSPTLDVTELVAASHEVQAGEDLRRIALRLLRVHPPRATDALQLAAALTWAGSPPFEGAELVTLDARLAEAAVREGFVVRPS